MIPGLATNVGWGLAPAVPCFDPGVKEPGQAPAYDVSVPSGSAVPGSLNVTGLARISHQDPEFWGNLAKQIGRSTAES